MGLAEAARVRRVVGESERTGWVGAPLAAAKNSTERVCTPGTGPARAGAWHSPRRRWIRTRVIWSKGRCKTEVRSGEVS